MKKKNVTLSVVEQRFLFRLLDERYYLVENKIDDDISEQMRLCISTQLDFIDGIKRKLDLILNDAL